MSPEFGARFGRHSRRYGARFGGHSRPDGDTLKAADQPLIDIAERPLIHAR